MLRIEIIVQYVHLALLRLSEELEYSNFCDCGIQCAEYYPLVMVNGLQARNASPPKFE